MPPEPGSGNTIAENSRNGKMGKTAQMERRKEEGSLLSHALFAKAHR